MGTHALDLVQFVNMFQADESGQDVVEYCPALGRGRLLDSNTLSSTLSNAIQTLNDTVQDRITETGRSC